jgi:hypothetical protein
MAAAAVTISHHNDKAGAGACPTLRACANACVRARWDMRLFSRASAAFWQERGLTHTPAAPPPVGRPSWSRRCSEPGQGPQVRFAVWRCFARGRGRRADPEGSVPEAHRPRRGWYANEHALRHVLSSWLLPPTLDARLTVLVAILVCNRVQCICAGLKRKALLQRLELELDLQRGLRLLVLCLCMFAVVIFASVIESQASVRRGQCPPVHQRV